MEKFQVNYITKVYQTARGAERNFVLVAVLHVPLQQPTVGPILDDRMKEKFLKPWKGVLLTFVSVCLSIRELPSTLFDLGT